MTWRELQAGLLRIPDEHLDKEVILETESSEGEPDFECLELGSVGHSFSNWFPDFKEGEPILKYL
jgi:hypothetical protein